MTPLDEVDVIVPVLGRPHHAAPFMASLQASDAPAFVLAVASHDDHDTAEAWAAAGADVLRTDPGRTTFPQKANDGYRATSRPWFLLVGSDVAFWPGWWRAAHQGAVEHDASVVSTNDMFNGHVQEGRLAVHPIFSRVYVDELGASWDGPGVVACEEYAHWYCDEEWSQVARSRGVFLFVPDAVVEHLHPAAGRADMDDVYRLGYRNAVNDEHTFRARAARHAGDLA